MLEADRLDQLLSKYVHVWLWSILVGVSTGITFSFLSFRMEQPWGTLGTVLLAFYAIGLIAAIGSWLSLLRYLVGFLIPAFLLSHEDTAEARHGAAYSLRSAFMFILLAAFARISVTVAEVALEVLDSWGLAGGSRPF